MLGLVSSVGATEPAPTQVERVVAKENWAGIYRFVDEEDAEGKRFRKTQVLRETSTIPARLGVQFGYRLNLEGKCGWVVPLKSVIHLPPPGRRTQDGVPFERTERYLLSAACEGETGIGYAFDTPDELLPGPWTFELWNGDERIYARTFDVVPDERPNPSDATR